MPEEKILKLFNTLKNYEVDGQPVDFGLPPYEEFAKSFADGKKKKKIYDALDSYQVVEGEKSKKLFNMKGFEAFDKEFVLNPHDALRIEERAQKQALEEMRKFAEEYPESPMAKELEAYDKEVQKEVEDLVLETASQPMKIGQLGYQIGSLVPKTGQAIYYAVTNPDDLFFRVGRSFHEGGEAMWTRTKNVFLTLGQAEIQKNKQFATELTDENKAKFDEVIDAVETEKHEMHKRHLKRIESIRESWEKYLNPDLHHTFYDEAVSGLSSMALMVGASVLNPVLGVAAGVTLEGQAVADDIYQQAIANGDSEEDAWGKSKIAAVAGDFLGATEYFPIKSYAKSIRSGLRKILGHEAAEQVAKKSTKAWAKTTASWAKTFLGEASEEAAQEFGQTMGEQALGAWLTEGKFDIFEAIKAGYIGFLLGGHMATGGRAFKEVSNKRLLNRWAEDTYEIYGKTPEERKNMGFFDSVLNDVLALANYQPSNKPLGWRSMKRLMDKAIKEADISEAMDKETGLVYQALLLGMQKQAAWKNKQSELTGKQNIHDDKVMAGALTRLVQEAVQKLENSDAGMVEVENNVEGEAVVAELLGINNLFDKKYLTHNKERIKGIREQAKVLKPKFDKILEKVLKDENSRLEKIEEENKVVPEAYKDYRAERVEAIDLNLVESDIPVAEFLSKNDISTAHLIEMSKLNRNKPYREAIKKELQKRNRAAVEIENFDGEQEIFSQPSHTEKNHKYMKQISNFFFAKFGVKTEIINQPETEKKGWVKVGERNEYIVVLNEAYASVDTPVYEYSFVLLNLIRNENKPLFSSLIKEIKNNPEAKSIEASLKKRFPEMEDQEVIERTIVEMLKRYGMQHLETAEGRSVVEKIWNAIKDFLSQAFNVKIYEISPTVNMHDLMKLLLSDRTRLVTKELVVKKDMEIAQMINSSITDVTEKINKLEEVKERVEDAIVIEAGYKMLVIGQAAYNKLTNDLNRITAPILEWINSEKYAETINTLHGRFLEGKSKEEALAAISSNMAELIASYPAFINFVRLDRRVSTTSAIMIYRTLKNHQEGIEGDMSIDDEERIRRKITAAQRELTNQYRALSIIGRIFRNYGEKQLYEDFGVVFPENALYLMRNDVEFSPDIEQLIQNYREKLETIKTSSTEDFEDYYNRRTESFNVRIDEYELDLDLMLERGVITQLEHSRAISQGWVKGNDNFFPFWEKWIDAILSADGPIKPSEAKLIQVDDVFSVSGRYDARTKTVDVVFSSARHHMDDIGSGNFYKILPPVMEKVSAMFPDVPIEFISFTPMTGETGKNKGTRLTRLKGYNIFAKRLFTKDYSLIWEESDYSTKIPVPSIFKSNFMLDGKTTYQPLDEEIFDVVTYIKRKGWNTGDKATADFINGLESGFNTDNIKTMNVPGGPKATYNRKTEVITFNLAELDSLEEVNNAYMEELVHHATVRVLGIKKQFRKEVLLVRLRAKARLGDENAIILLKRFGIYEEFDESLIKEIKDDPDLKRKLEYYFKDEYEFVAGAISDSGVRKLLGRIKVAGKTSLKGGSLWERFLNVIAKYLGPNRSLLDAFTEVMARNVTSVKAVDNVSIVESLLEEKKPLSGMTPQAVMATEVWEEFATAWNDTLYKQDSDFLYLFLATNRPARNALRVIMDKTRFGAKRRNETNTMVSKVKAKPGTNAEIEEIVFNMFTSNLLLEKIGLKKAQIIGAEPQETGKEALVEERAQRTEQELVSQILNENHDDSFYDEETDVGDEYVFSFLTIKSLSQLFGNTDTHPYLWFNDKFDTFENFYEEMKNQPKFREKIEKKRIATNNQLDSITYYRRQLINIFMKTKSYRRVKMFGVDIMKGGSWAQELPFVFTSPTETAERTSLERKTELDNMIGLLMEHLGIEDVEVGYVGYMNEITENWWGIKNRQIKHNQEEVDWKEMGKAFGEINALSMLPFSDKSTFPIVSFGSKEAFDKFIAIATEVAQKLPFAKLPEGKQVGAYTAGRILRGMIEGMKQGVPLERITELQDLNPDASLGEKYKGFVQSNKRAHILGFQNSPVVTDVLWEDVKRDNYIGMRAVSEIDKMGWEELKGKLDEIDPIHLRKLLPNGEAFDYRLLEQEDIELLRSFVKEHIDGNEKDIHVRTAVIAPPEPGTMIDIGGKEYDLHALLVNAYGIQRFDGQGVFMFGHFDQVYAEATGDIFGGSFKPFYANKYGEEPIFFKYALHGIPPLDTQNVLAKWMIENKIGMIVFDKGEKMGGFPRIIPGSDENFENIQELSLKQFYPLLNNMPAKVGLGGRQALTAAVTYAGSEMNDVIHNIFMNKYDGLEKGLKNLTSSDILEYVEKLASGNPDIKQQQLVDMLSPMIDPPQDELLGQLRQELDRSPDAVREGEIKKAISELNADRKVYLEKLSESLGGIFNHALVADRLNDFVNSHFSDYFRMKMHGGLGLLESDMGALAQERIKIVEKFASDNNYEINDILDNNQFLKEGWAYVSENIAKKFGIENGDELVNIVVPTDSPKSMNVSKVIILPDGTGKKAAVISPTKLIFNSENIQGQTGRDFDWDKLYFMAKEKPREGEDYKYYTPEQWNKLVKNIKEYSGKGGKFDQRLASSMSERLSGRIIRGEDGVERTFYPAMAYEDNFRNPSAVAYMQTFFGENASGFGKELKHFIKDQAEVANVYKQEIQKVAVLRRSYAMLAAMDVEIEVNGASMFKFKKTKESDIADYEITMMWLVNHVVDFPNNTSRLEYGPKSLDYLLSEMRYLMSGVKPTRALTEDGEVTNSAAALEILMNGLTKPFDAVVGNVDVGSSSLNSRILNLKSAKRLLRIIRNGNNEDLYAYFTSKKSGVTIPKQFQKVFKTLVMGLKMNQMKNSLLAHPMIAAIDAINVGDLVYNKQFGDRFNDYVFAEYNAINTLLKSDMFDERFTNISASFDFYKNRAIESHPIDIFFGALSVLPNQYAHLKREAYNSIPGVRQAEREQAKEEVAEYKLLRNLIIEYVRIPYEAPNRTNHDERSRMFTTYITDYFASQKTIKTEADSWTARTTGRVKPEWEGMTFKTDSDGMYIEWNGMVYRGETIKELKSQLIEMFKVPDVRRSFNEEFIKLQNVIPYQVREEYADKIMRHTVKFIRESKIFNNKNEALAIFQLSLMGTKPSDSAGSKSQITSLIVPGENGKFPKVDIPITLMSRFPVSLNGNNLLQEYLNMYNLFSKSFAPPGTDEILGPMETTPEVFNQIGSEDILEEQVIKYIKATNEGVSDFIKGQIKDFKKQIFSATNDPNLSEADVEADLRAIINSMLARGGAMSVLFANNDILFKMMEGKDFDLDRLKVDLDIIRENLPKVSKEIIQNRKVKELLIMADLLIDEFKIYESIQDERKFPGGVSFGTITGVADHDTHTIYNRLHKDVTFGWVVGDGLHEIKGEQVSATLGVFDKSYSSYGVAKVYEVLMKRQEENARLLAGKFEDTIQITKNIFLKWQDDHIYEFESKFKEKGKKRKLSETYPIEAEEEYNVQIFTFLEGGFETAGITFEEGDNQELIIWKDGKKYDKNSIYEAVHFSSKLHEASFRAALEYQRFYGIISHNAVINMKAYLENYAEWFYGRNDMENFMVADALLKKYEVHLDAMRNKRWRYAPHEITAKEFITIYKAKERIRLTNEWIELRAAQQNRRASNEEVYRPGEPHLVNKTDMEIDKLVQWELAERMAGVAMDGPLTSVNPHMMYRKFSEIETGYNKYSHAPHTNYAAVLGEMIRKDTAFILHAAFNAQAEHLSPFVRKYMNQHFGAYSRHWLIQTKKTEGNRLRPGNKVTFMKEVFRVNEEGDLVRTLTRFVGRVRKVEDGRFSLSQGKGDDINIEKNKLFQRYEDFMRDALDFELTGLASVMPGASTHDIMDIMANEDQLDLFSDQAELINSADEILEGNDSRAIHNVVSQLDARDIQPSPFSTYKPATSKQIAFMHKLGFSPNDTENITKVEAILMITAAINLKSERYQDIFSNNMPFMQDILDEIQKLDVDPHMEGVKQSMESPVSREAFAANQAAKKNWLYHDEKMLKWQLWLSEARTPTSQDTVSRYNLIHEFLELVKGIGETYNNHGVDEVHDVRKFQKPGLMEAWDEFNKEKIALSESGFGWNFAWKSSKLTHDVLDNALSIMNIYQSHFQLGLIRGPAAAVRNMLYGIRALLSIYGHTLFTMRGEGSTHKADWREVKKVHENPTPENLAVLTDKQRILYDVATAQGLFNRSLMVRVFYQGNTMAAIPSEVSALSQGRIAKGKRIFAAIRHSKSYEAHLANMKAIKDSYKSPTEEEVREYAERNELPIQDARYKMEKQLREDMVLELAEEEFLWQKSKLSELKKVPKDYDEVDTFNLDEMIKAIESIMDETAGVNVAETFGLSRKAAKRMGWAFVLKEIEAASMFLFQRPEEFLRRKSMQMHIDIAQKAYKSAHGGGSLDEETLRIVANNALRQQAMYDPVNKVIGARTRLGRLGLKFAQFPIFNFQEWKRLVKELMQQRKQVGTRFIFNSKWGSEGKFSVDNLGRGHVNLNKIVISKMSSSLLVEAVYRTMQLIGYKTAFQAFHDPLVGVFISFIDMLSGIDDDEEKRKVSFDVLQLRRDAMQFLGWGYNSMIESVLEGYNTDWYSKNPYAKKGSVESRQSPLKDLNWHLRHNPFINSGTTRIIQSTKQAIEASGSDNNKSRIPFKKSDDVKFPALGRIFGELGGIGVYPIYEEKEERRLFPER